mmetsp:Transcript_19103/g.62695  ORF Transcript_19103/g.62695 Transcript_19103/m.62695 type:complete len:218 (+) Transcript_19103:1568-2221(+)
MSFSRFSASMKGRRWATAFFMTRADLMTWGRNILPAPNRSPTTFMPAMSGPSMTSRGVPPAFLMSRRISSVSSLTNSEMPLTNACVSRSPMGRSRHVVFLATATAPPFLRASAASFSASVAWSRRSVASGRRLSTASSQTSRSWGGTSLMASISAALTMPMSMPDMTAAWCRKTAWMDSRIWLTPRNPKLKFDTPPEILHQGQISLIWRTAVMKSMP